MAYGIPLLAVVAAGGPADVGVLVATAKVDDSDGLEAVHPGAAGVVPDVDVLLVPGAVGAGEGIDSVGIGAGGDGQSGGDEVGEVHLQRGRRWAGEVR